MVDTHLINIALAGLGISAGAAILIAVAIIAISAIVLNGRKHRSIAPRGSRLAGAPDIESIPTVERQAA